MAVTQIYLQGGPCDGKTVSADQITGGLVGYIKCGGGYYTQAGGQKRPNGDPIFGYVGKQPPKETVDQLGHDAKALQGWGDLRRTFNHGLPTALRHTSKLTNASLRQIRRHHKVKG